MKNLKYRPAFALVAALQIVTVGAFAQPDPNNAPKAENPANRNPFGGGRNRLQMQQGQQLDPAALQQMMEQRSKRQLERAGITDATQQDAILTYTKGEREAEMKLREKGQELQRAMRGNALSETQLIGLVNEYNVAIEENKERRAKAINTLKQTIDFNKYPRVEAYLLLGGFYGDGPAVVGGGGMGGGRFAAGQGLMNGAQGQRGNRRNQNGAQGDAANPAAGEAPRRNRNRQRNNTPEAPAAPIANL